MAVIADHDVIDVGVVGPARDRGESDGHGNDNREKKLFHDRLDLSRVSSQQLTFTFEPALSISYVTQR
jgi:hypothetical protein